MEFIKKIERGYRQIRSYIQPSHYRSAAKARSLAVDPPCDTPICLFDFHSIEIDSDMGRYLHHLVTEFEASGYHIAFTNKHRFLGSIDSKAFKRLILSRPFSILELATPPASCRLLVTDSPATAHAHFHKIITLNYQDNLACDDDSTELNFPYFVHPEVHDTKQVSHFQQNQNTQTPRFMRILFAGNASAPKYDHPELKEKYQVLSRIKALNIAQKSISANQLRRPSSISKLIPSSPSNTLTIATTQTCNIPSENWISILGAADFYLALPGVNMPLSHNLIEAIASGAIPILQYPQYLSPHLKHNENCLVFNSETELTNIIQQALSMSLSEITRLRQNVFHYYKKNLQPGHLAQQILEHPSENITLYMNSHRVPQSLEI